MQNSNKENQELFNGVMLNAYPDSIGDNLGDIIRMLSLPEFKNAFSLQKKGREGRGPTTKPEKGG